MNSPITRQELRAAAHRIHIGGVFASRSPAVVYTLLGSCISVCLRDPESGVGGMNHFMLPGNATGNTGNNGELIENRSRYGVHAMELLINECMKKGASRHKLEAKVFGGGHVLNFRVTDGNVPQSNIDFALSFLRTERIPLVTHDIGGHTGREIYYFTDSGKTLLRRLSPTKSSEQIAEMARQETAQLAKYAQDAATEADNVTLF